MPDSPAFTELMKIEQKLDWTLLRKKAEINDALGRSTRVKRTLRVFLSNTVHNQPWQTGSSGEEKDGDVQMGEEKKAEGENKEGENKEGGDGETKEGEENKAEGSSTAAAPTGVDVKTGNGVAGWVLRIEGRLLDVSTSQAGHDLTRRLETIAWTSRSASSRRSCDPSSSSSTTARPRRSPRATLSSGIRTRQPSLSMASRSSAAATRTSKRASFCT